jgi:hypothetical protein
MLALNGQAGLFLLGFPIMDFGQVVLNLMATSIFVQTNM